jgi:hypothetical protein
MLTLQIQMEKQKKIRVVKEVLVPFNVLSLFDGMSCGQIALDRANIPINKYFA